MDEPESSLPLSESIIEAEQAGSTSPSLSSECLNCGIPLTGPFCSSCGQKNMPRRQGMGDLLLNFLGSFTSFDSKFFRTLSTLLFKPGLITQEYNAGKREKYFHPARMYVFLSFIFFLIFSLIPEESIIEIHQNGRELTTEEKKQYLDSADVNWGQEAWLGIGPESDYAYDSAQMALPVDQRDGKIEQYFTRKLIKQRIKNKRNARGFWRSYASDLGDNIPKMIFFLLPVFALLLRFLYFRRDFYYAEHLVFSVFFYDFVYLLGIIGLLASLVSWLEWVPIVLTLLVFFYLYKSMRKVYGQQRFKTMMKFFLLVGVFLSCLIIAIALNAVITLMMV